MPHNDKEILARCPHEDTAKRGNSTQPDKASENKERGCGRCPTEETLGIIKGGGPEPSTRTPPLCNCILINEARWVGGLARGCAVPKSPPRTPIISVQHMPTAATMSPATRRVL